MIIKPEAVRRGLVGQILERFERKGLLLRRLELREIPPQTAREHYAHHADKPFFAELIESITSGPVVMAVLEGEEAVTVVRNLVGPTDPVKAPPGTIRGDLARALPDNLVHASDSPETARSEIARFF